MERLKNMTEAKYLKHHVIGCILSDKSQFVKLIQGDMLMIPVLIQVALWIWFLGCTITYRVKNYILVEGMGIKSAEFIMLCFYSIGLISYHLFQPVGKWILLTVLVLWFAIQFLGHWYYTIFGASEKKIAGYNECFERTLRIFPMSEKRLVPDLYHIILHILIVVNIFLCLM